MDYRPGDLIHDQDFNTNEYVIKRHKTLPIGTNEDTSSVFDTRYYSYDFITDIFRDPKLPHQTFLSKALNLFK